MKENNLWATYNCLPISLFFSFISRIKKSYFLCSLCCDNDKATAKKKTKMFRQHHFFLIYWFALHKHYEADYLRFSFPLNREIFYFSTQHAKRKVNKTVARTKRPRNAFFCCSSSLSINRITWSVFGWHVRRDTRFSPNKKRQEIKNLIAKEKRKYSVASVVM